MSAPVCARLAILLGFTLVVQQARSQSAPSLVGVVTDEKSDVPLAGATVVIPGTLHGAVTGMDGAFAFDAIQRGAWVLVVSAPGYEVLRHEFTIAADTVVQVSLKLRRIAASLPDFNPIAAAFGMPMQALHAELQRLPGILPARQSGIEFGYSMRGLHLPVYLDGVRLLEPTLALIPAESIEMLYLASGPLGLEWGAGGMHIVRSSTLPPGAELAYDSRSRGVRSSIAFRKATSQAYGEVNGGFHAVQDYEDGSGNLQPSEVSAGRIETRGGLNMGSRHDIYGSAALEYRRKSVHGTLDRQDIVTRYAFKPEQGILRGLTMHASLQRLDGSVEARQQGARLALLLVPTRGWQVSTGAEYYGRPVVDLHETGAFVTLTHASGRLVVITAGRVERVTNDNRSARYWSTQAGGKLTVSRTWALLFGVGHSGGIQLQSAAWEVLSQADIGAEWKAASLRAFTRSLGNKQSSGLEIRAATSLPRSLGRMKMSGTLIREPELPPAWGSVELTLTAPAQLAQLGFSTYGAMRADDSSGWLTGNVWMHLRLPHMITLSFSTTNVLDRTYAWPAAPTVTSQLLEPGRSFEVSLRYGR